MSVCPILSLPAPLRSLPSLRRPDCFHYKVEGQCRVRILISYIFMNINWHFDSRRFFLLSAELRLMLYTDPVSGKTWGCCSKSEPAISSSHCLSPRWQPFAFFLLCLCIQWLSGEAIPLSALERQYPHKLSGRIWSTESLLFNYHGA